MIVKLTRWAIFSVLGALAPLYYNALRFSAEGKGTAEVVQDTIGGGELLLITAALCATAIGGLVGSGKDKELRKIIGGGACFLILMLVLCQGSSEG